MPVCRASSTRGCASLTRMFCPSCRDEFRSGFTRCATCDVDLVDSLEAVPARGPRPDPHGPVDVLQPFVDFCGFLDLTEAREARDELRRRGVLARIVLRENPTGSLEGPVNEEFWLQVQAHDVPATVTCLGVDAADSEPDTGGTFRCSECGNDVNEAEAFCSGCGMRFETER